MAKGLENLGIIRIYDLTPDTGVIPNISIQSKPLGSGIEAVTILSTGIENYTYSTWGVYNNSPLLYNPSGVIGAISTPFTSNVYISGNITGKYSGTWDELTGYLAESLVGVKSGVIFTGNLTQVTGLTQPKNLLWPLNSRYIYGYWDEYGNKNYNNRVKYLSIIDGTGGLHKFKTPLISIAEAINTNDINITTGDIYSGQLYRSGLLDDKQYIKFKGFAGDFSGISGIQNWLNAVPDSLFNWRNFIYNTEQYNFWFTNWSGHNRTCWGQINPTGALKEYYFNCFNDAKGPWSLLPNQIPRPTGMYNAYYDSGSTAEILWYENGDLYYELSGINVVSGVPSGFFITGIINKVSGYCVGGSDNSTSSGNIEGPSVKLFTIQNINNSGWNKFNVIPEFTHASYFSGSPSDLANNIYTGLSGTYITDIYPLSKSEVYAGLGYLSSGLYNRIKIIHTHVSKNVFENGTGINKPQNVLDRLIIDKKITDTSQINYFTSGFWAQGAFGAAELDENNFPLITGSVYVDYKDIHNPLYNLININFGINKSYQLHDNFDYRPLNLLGRNIHNTDYDRFILVVNSGVFGFSGHSGIFAGYRDDKEVRIFSGKLPITGEITSIIDFIFSKNNNQDNITWSCIARLNDGRTTGFALGDYLKPYNKPWIIYDNPKYGNDLKLISNNSSEINNYDNLQASELLSELILEPPYSGDNLIINNIDYNDPNSYKVIFRSKYNVTGDTIIGSKQYILDLPKTGFYNPSGFLNTKDVTIVPLIKSPSINELAGFDTGFYAETATINIKNALLEIEHNPPTGFFYLEKSLNQYVQYTYDNSQEKQFYRVYSNNFNNYIWIEYEKAQELFLTSDIYFYPSGVHLQSYPYKYSYYFNQTNKLPSGVFFEPYLFIGSELPFFIPQTGELFSGYLVNQSGTGIISSNKITGYNLEQTGVIANSGEYFHPIWISGHIESVQIFSGVATGFNYLSGITGYTLVPFNGKANVKVIGEKNGVVRFNINNSNIQDNFYYNDIINLFSDNFTSGSNWNKSSALIFDQLHGQATKIYPYLNEGDYDYDINLQIKLHSTGNKLVFPTYQPTDIAWASYNLSSGFEYKSVIGYSITLNKEISGVNIVFNNSGIAPTVSWNAFEFSDLCKIYDLNSESLGTCVGLGDNVITKLYEEGVHGCIAEYLASGDLNSPIAAQAIKEKIEEIVSSLRGIGDIEPPQAASLDENTIENYNYIFTGSIKFNDIQSGDKLRFRSYNFKNNLGNEISYTGKYSGIYSSSPPYPEYAFDLIYPQDFTNIEELQTVLNNKLYNTGIWLWYDYDFLYNEPSGYFQYGPLAYAEIKSGEDFTNNPYISIRSLRRGLAGNYKLEWITGLRHNTISNKVISRMLPSTIILEGSNDNMSWSTVDIRNDINWLSIPTTNKFVTGCVFSGLSGNINSSGIEASGSFKELPDLIWTGSLSFNDLCNHSYSGIAVNIYTGTIEECQNLFKVEDILEGKEPPTSNVFGDVCLPYSIKYSFLKTGWKIDNTQEYDYYRVVLSGLSVSGTHSVIEPIIYVDNINLFVSGSGINTTNEQIFTGTPMSVINSDYSIKSKGVVTGKIDSYTLDYSITLEDSGVKKITAHVITGLGSPLSGIWGTGTNYTVISPSFSGILQDTLYFTGEIKQDIRNYFYDPNTNQISFTSELTGIIESGSYTGGLYYITNQKVVLTENTIQQIIIAGGILDQLSQTINISTGVFLSGYQPYATLTGDLFCFSYVPITTGIFVDTSDFGKKLVTFSYTGTPNSGFYSGTLYDNKASGIIELITPEENDTIYINNFQLTYKNSPSNEFEFNSSTGLANNINLSTGLYLTQATANGNSVYLTSVLFGESGNNILLDTITNNSGIVVSSNTLQSGFSFYQEITPTGLFTGEDSEYVYPTGLLTGLGTGIITGQINSFTGIRYFTGVWNIFTGTNDFRELNWNDYNKYYNFISGDDFIYTDLPTKIDLYIGYENVFSILNSIPDIALLTIYDAIQGTGISGYITGVN